jgi:hypothetical protein
MAITIDIPIVRVDGVRTTLFGLDNPFFTRMKKSLRDDQIYDVSEASVPFTNRIVTFTGTASEASQAIIAYNETRNGKKQVKSWLANADHSFEFSVLLVNGRNKISVESANGSQASNAISLNAYRLQAWLYTYAEELDTIRSYTAQLRQDRKLRDSTDFEDASVDNTGQGLTEAFGQFIEPLVRLDTFTVSQWRSGIRNTLLAYDNAASVLSMNKVARFFTNEDAEFKWYKDENRLRRPMFSDNFFMASAANPGSDTTFTWKTTRFYLYNKWWVGRRKTITLTTDTTSWVYYDGTEAESNTSLAYQVVTGTPPQANAPKLVTETVASGNILRDATGSATGLTGELYFQTTFPVSGLIGVSGSAGWASGGIPDASKVEGSNFFIDLGHAQLGQSKQQYFGDLTVNYATPQQIFEVAEVMASSTTITGMITGQRFDEASGVIRETQVAQNCGEMLIYNSQNLASGTRNLLTGVLVDTKPPRSFFHVFMEDPTTGDMSYYAKV